MQTEQINPYLRKRLEELLYEPITPTDELKKIIGYQEIIPTTFEEIKESNNGQNEEGKEVLQSCGYDGF